MATATGRYSSYPTKWFLLRIECYEISTNIANNTSVVRMDAWLDFTANGSTYTPGYITMNINGVSNNIGSAGYISGTNGTSYLIASGYDVTVGHNADGSYTTGFSAYHPTNFFGDASASGSVGLTNFDRSAGLPGTMTAAAVTGVSGRIDVSWGASTSYINPVTYYHSYRSSSNGGVSYGDWSGESTTTNNYASYTSLTPGLTYQFRVRAYNGQDNFSGYRESNTVFLVAGGKRYYGPNSVTDWALTAAQAKRWTGSAWTSLGTLKRFDGTNWVNLS